MLHKKWNILFIEDEILISLALKSQLSKKFNESIEYHFSKSFSTAEKIIQNLYQRDEGVLLVCDYNLGGETADTFLRKVDSQFPEVSKILLSAHEKPEILESEIQIKKFIRKPWSEREISEVIEAIILKGFL